MGSATIAPAVDFPSYNLSQFASVRFTGTIQSPATEVATLHLETDGLVRLWVDDQLLISDNTYNLIRNVSAVLDFPFAAGAAYTIRLEYAHYDVSQCTLVMRWNSSSTNLSVVPASAYTTAVSPTQLKRDALRSRLENPAVPWQTWDNPTMGCHVHAATGFGMYVTLADRSTGDVLGDITVFRRFSPAAVTVGPHSLNGSDYSEVLVESWAGRACSVTLRSTVIGTGMPTFAFLATSNGTDCGRMLLLTQPRLLWQAAGSAEQLSNASLRMNLAGGSPFPPPGDVYSVTDNSLASFAMGGPVYLAWQLSTAGEAVGFSVGLQRYAVSEIEAAMATARRATVATRDRFPGELAEVWDALSTLIGWNTIYTPFEGVVTPVSRGWDFGAAYVLFDWDNLFLAYMAGLDPGMGKDLAYSNAIQTIQARTLDGFVPNYASGISKSYDRTEPMVGALIISKLFARYNDTWLVDAVFDSLMSWNDWVWRRRRAEGVWATQPDGVADLICLGSDPNPHPGGDDWSMDIMQGARYESGLDNFPGYDGPDGDSQGPGPVTYSNVTHHMELYDIGMTGLYLSDTQALAALASATGRKAQEVILNQRFARVSAATTAHLWDGGSSGPLLFKNVLFNGTIVDRNGPTALYPLLSGTASEDQVRSIIEWAASPQGLCLNRSYVAGSPFAAPLAQWWHGGDFNDSEAVLTDVGHAQAVKDSYGFLRIEGVALNASAGPAPGLIRLRTFLSRHPTQDYLLTTSTTPPAGYELVRVEGWCYTAPAPGRVNLTLWYSAPFSDYATCGSEACVRHVLNMSYARVGTDPLCYVIDGTQPESWPCRFGGNSVSRDDPAFAGGTANYWRGRIWGPQMQLMYWALDKYAYMPEAKAARESLAAGGLDLMLFLWRNFRQVCENANGLLGTCEDLTNADPFYSWGALMGFMSFEEAGLY